MCLRKKTPILGEAKNTVLITRSKIPQPHLCNELVRDSYLSLRASTLLHSIDWKIKPFRLGLEVGVV